MIPKYEQNPYQQLDNEVMKFLKELQNTEHAKEFWKSINE